MRMSVTLRILLIIRDTAYPFISFSCSDVVFFTSQVDLLAVTIGNVHGEYASEPNLDLTRLEAIARAVPHTPLVSACCFVCFVC